MGTILALPPILKHTLAQRGPMTATVLSGYQAAHATVNPLPPPSPEGSFTLQSKDISRHPKERHVTHSHGNTHQHERKLEATRPTFATQHFHYNSMVIPYPKRHRQAFKTEASQLYECARGVGRKVAVTKTSIIRLRNPNVTQERRSGALAHYTAESIAPQGQGKKSLFYCAIHGSGKVLAGWRT